MGLKLMIWRLYTRLMQMVFPKERIWLYGDRLDSTDNAFYQFQYDTEQKDNVVRYYLWGSGALPKALQKYKKQVVIFGSLRHKLLYLRCEKILSSFSQFSLIHPFSRPAVKGLSKATRFEVLYLQHGVLHAKLPDLYHRDNLPCERMVISTAFERQNMLENYGFEEKDLLLTGMARYDFLRPEKKPQRRILYSPSWRKNLIGPLIRNVREPYYNTLFTSRYFNELQAFLNSPRLAALLEKHNLTLDFQSHPIFRVYDGTFMINNPRVRIGGAADLNPYQVMITDYSSIALDFVYLERPLLYFVPDYQNFLEGQTHSYSELHIPLEEAFGPLAETEEGLLAELEALAARDFAPAPVYAQRMHEFFSDRNATHRKALYDTLI